MSLLRKISFLVILLVVLETLPGFRGWAGEPCSPPNPWNGIYPTVVTPFAPCGGIDIRALECQLRYELDGGVHGLLVLGTYGEGAYVTAEERAQVIATAVRVSKGRVPVVVGIHSSCFDQARGQLLQARELGAAAVLVKYAGDSQASPSTVRDFFAALSALEVLPIFYYHYPAQTAIRLSPIDMAEILSLPNVVGVKESTLNLREMQAHMAAAHGLNKAFFCSTSLMLTQFLHAGGHGAMCPEAVLLPGATVQCYGAFRHGKHDDARAIQAELFALTPIFRSRQSPTHLTRAIFTAAQDHQIPLPMASDQPQARVKAALTYLCVPTPSFVKCPIPPLTPSDLARVQSAVRDIKQIDWCAVAWRTQPVPQLRCAESGGMILKSGAFMLGSNVGKNILGIQGDGKSGFMD
jgi:4-hydroxy-tetrahydrodipicolinate synthase